MLACQMARSWVCCFGAVAIALNPVRVKQRRRRIALPVEKLPNEILGRFGEVGMIGQFQYAVEIGERVIDQPLSCQADPPLQVRVRVVGPDQHELSKVGEGRITVAAPARILPRSK